MNKYLLLGAIVIGLTISCSNSSQSNNADKAINQTVAQITTTNGINI